MYKKLLVPLDGSKRAELILRHVEEMARRYEAEVVFMQVVEPPLIVQPGIVQPDTFNMALFQQEHERLIHVANEYLTGLQGEFRAKGIKAKMTVVTGPVVEAIIEAAELEGADLICIASHGRTGLSRVFYGSVAAGVLQRIDRPLLMIRSGDVS